MSKKAPAEELRPVIAGLLADGPHREAAARLGEQVRAMPGAAHAADQIESLLRNGASEPGHREARR